MPANHNRLSQFLVLLGDFALLNAAFFGAAWQRFRDLPFFNTPYYDYYLQLWLILNLLWLVLSLILAKMTLDGSLNILRVVADIILMLALLI